MIDTAIIIATGSSAHTSQLTYNRPLTMLPALGKPLCVRVMDRLYRTGIKKYVVVLGEQEGAVANYLNTRWIPGTEIEYVLKPGAMALGKVLSSIALNHNRPMMFANYNSFTHEKFPARLRKYHEFSPDDLILTGAASSLSTSSTQTFAQLKLPDNGNLTRKTSPRQAARRITALATSASNSLQNYVLADLIAGGANFIDFLQKLTPEQARCDTLLSLVKAHVNAGHMARLARASWVLQVQEDADLITLNRHLLDEKLDAHILSEVPYTVKIVGPVRIDPGVSVGQGAIIGPHVYLESGSSVGHQAKLKNSIVMGRASVKGHETVQDSIVSTRRRLQL